ncbi:MAG: molybdenum cofactor synthesis domain-containing protein [Pseudomonadota bacterium]
MSRLPNDCFALPPGVHWTPVDEALAALRERLSPVVGTEQVALARADGRILAEDAIARRSHPATDNAAVDGYAFAHPGVASSEVALTLRDGRSAAGAPWSGVLTPGEAVRIFTGAAMPAGADTVVLQEDVELQGASIRFPAPRKAGANRRKAGENVSRGGVALSAGAVVTPQALAHAAAAGLAALSVHERLRVAVFSTGDEVVDDPGAAVRGDEVVDSNRPMLLSMIGRLGFEAVDLGVIPDKRAAVEAALDRGAEQAHAIIASGGASGGDEDHMSRALSEAADSAFHLWRIAVKPGRPLAMGLRSGRPVFGLPGNPIAAFVCFAIFARPALLRLAGAPWSEPARLMLPSGFDYNKKIGRREFLRVRMGANGRLEKYRSEGSGLIEGLVWADGLADIAQEAGPFKAGDPIAYIPFSALGVAG